MVLILVVVEDSLWHHSRNSRGIAENYHVLILVVVEDSLWPEACRLIVPNLEKS